MNLNALNFSLITLKSLGTSCSEFQTNVSLPIRPQNLVSRLKIGLMANKQTMLVCWSRKRYQCPKKILYIIRTIFTAFGQHPFTVVPSIGILSSVRDTQSFVNDKHRSQKGVCSMRSNGWKDIYMLRYKRYTSLDLGSTRMGSDHWSCLPFALDNEGINYGHTSGSDSRPPTADQGISFCAASET